MEIKRSLQIFRQVVRSPGSLRLALGVGMLALLFASAILLTRAGAAPAAGPFTVNTVNDTHDASPANDACADSDGNCSLRAAIEQATASGGATTITLPPGTYNLSLGELKAGNTAGTSITLAGTGTPANTIINQTDGTNRVFNVDYLVTGNITISISNVTIQNGVGGSGGGGGAILDGGVGDVLNLTNVVFSGNHTSAYNGGAISFTGGGTLNVQNSTFINNSSPSGNGGAIHFSQTQTGAFTVVNSIFVGNTASGGPIGGQGGAINVGCNLCNPFSITGSTFSDNTAAQVESSGGQGGAIMFGAGSLTLNNNRITGNHANGGGTGIYGGGGTGDATKNWWGCNAGPGAGGCDTIMAAAGTITFNPWLREIMLPIISKP